MLSVSHVGKNYDGNWALKDVSFVAAANRVTAVCGENGAGKSTLMRILSGAIRPDTGEISLGENHVAITGPHHAIELGIQTVYQELSLLPHLSVAENILLGKMPHRNAEWIVDWGQTETRAGEVLRDFGFPDIDVRALVSDLSVSIQQIVEIAKALVLPPRVLILDEPTAVLSARETDHLFRKIRELAAKGTAVLYISHRLEEVFEIADDVVVLKDGNHVLSAETKSLNRDQLINAMVGRSLEAIYPVRNNALGPIVLEVRDLGKAGAFDEVSFDARAGEIVGMFGLVGSGRTDVAKAIFGAEPAHSGEILVDGKPLTIASPMDAVSHGISFVTEDRKRDGLLLDAEIVDNVALASMQRFANRGFLNNKNRSTAVSTILEKLQVRPRGATGPVRRLSGGNQQKVIFGKWMLVENTRLLILDEPTRGVDIATKVQIYQMIADLAAGGLAILLISSEMPEVLGLSNRVLIMRQGRIVAVLDQDDFDMEMMFTHAVGGAMKQGASAW